MCVLNKTDFKYYTIIKAAQTIVIQQSTCELGNMHILFRNSTAEQRLKEICHAPECV